MHGRIKLVLVLYSSGAQEREKRATAVEEVAQVPIPMSPKKENSCYYGSWKRLKKCDSLISKAGGEEN